MAENATDILMRVVRGGSDLAADSLVEFTTSVGQDELRDGFRPGYFCDLLEFDFSAGAEGSMSKRSKDKKEQEELLKKLAVAKPSEAPRWAKSRELLELELSQQQRKRANKRLDADVVDMQPVEYTRIMDSSSTLLFKALAECETLDQVSIVKRKASGVANSGLCYLRLDFEKVLFTRLDWKDEQHVMHESGTFIYRKLTVRYRPQLMSGALGAVVPMVWTMRGASA